MKRLVKLLSVLFFILSSWNLSYAQQDVWPGDVDNNGIVDNIDMLYIGIAQGAVGPPRATIDSVWMEFSATSWGISFPDTNLDYAYADCNGDGVVDDLDFNVVLLNLYQVHGSVTSTVFVPGNPGTNPELFFVPNNTLPIFETGDFVLPIHLGTAVQPATDFYGISFTIKFDPLVINPSTIIFFPFDFFGTSALETWISTSGDFFANSQDLSMLNPDPGTLEITIVKTDGNPISEGHGVIGTFFGIIEENVVNLINPNGNSVNSVLEIQDVRYINENLENTPTVYDTTEIIIIELDTTLLNNTTELLSDEITLYPNPADDLIFIQTPDIEVEQVIIMNQAGKVMYQRANIIQEETIEISTSHIPSGFYFVKLLTDKGLAVKKISIRR